jgi:hypothetical protein
VRTDVAIVLACLACLLLGSWLSSALRATRARRSGRARQLQGERGEHRAVRVLAAHGYAIHSRQAPLRYAIEVDGHPRATTVVADFVVERGGERLVAEVKTGSVAPRIERAETRRQLLEYQLATGARCVLLVDPDARTVSEVSFPLTFAVAPRASHGLRLAAALVVLALSAAWYAQKHPW